MLDLRSIRFPVVGTVNKVVHFSDMFHQYAFSFISPFVYDEPATYKARGAFLLAKFNPFNPNPNQPEEIYGYFIPDADSKKRVLNRKLNQAAKTLRFFTGDDTEVGSMEILIPNNHFFKFSPFYPNRIFDLNGNTIAFCHFQPQYARKCVYTFGEGFDLTRELIPTEAIELERSGVLTLQFAYNLRQKEVDFKARLEAMFSPSKKSENIINQIAMGKLNETVEANDLLLLAVVGYFWTTVIDLPITEF